MTQEVMHKHPTNPADPSSFNSSEVDINIYHQNQSFKQVQF